MKITIHKEVEFRTPQKLLRELADNIAKGEEIPAGHEVHVIFTNDETQQRLNNEYRGKNRTTDVLSFSYDPDERSNLIGEIYISIEVATSQARQFRSSLQHETVRLFCHGLLHVLGYDHDNDNSARIMEAKEQRYLGAVGLEAVA